MIRDVEMINWRAYASSRFEFKPGLNFVMGANGKGKTSILEAIAYGLTGEPSTLEDRTKLLRDPEKPAVVKLTFTINGSAYRAERSQTAERAGEASLWDVAKNTRIATHQKYVTEKIEGLIDVSADFLQRIVYMAEGDVFRFLQKPPGEALNLQVRRVLGLTQFDEFSKAIKLAKKDIQEQCKEIRSLLERMEKLQVMTKRDLDQKLQRLNETREKLFNEVRNFQAAITRQSQEEEEIYHLEYMIAERLDLWRADPNRYSRLQELPLITLCDELLEEINESEQKNSGIEREIAHLSGERSGYTRILDVLEPVAQGMDVLPCPVCAKPMTPEEREWVLTNTRESVREIDEKSDELSKQLSESRQKLREIKMYTNSVRELRDYLAHQTMEGINPMYSLREIQGSIQVMKMKFTRDEAETKIASQETELEEIEGERAEYLSVQSLLERLGFADPEEVQDLLIRLETRLISLSAASNAADDTLTGMRDVDLVSIYGQIGSLWNDFIQSGKWEMRLDHSGTPRLMDEAEREFDFSQFSGGEKTALLTMIHTVIAHYFSKCNFLMIDEPLEHLDAVNRRSLMRFLIGACRNKFFDQAIITTYEESLVRKYLSEDIVNVIYV